MTMIIIIGMGSITRSITKSIGITIMIGKCGETQIDGRAVCS